MQWFVKPGDSVDQFDKLCEVQSDKATVEIPSPGSGTIGELRADAGDVVPVGNVIFTLEGGGAAPAPAAASSAPPRCTSFQS